MGQIDLEEVRRRKLISYLYPNQDKWFITTRNISDNPIKSLQLLRVGWLVEPWTLEEGKHMMEWKPIWQLAVVQFQYWDITDRLFFSQTFTFGRVGGWVIPFNSWSTFIYGDVLAWESSRNDDLCWLWQGWTSAAGPGMKNRNTLSSSLFEWDELWTEWQLKISIHMGGIF